MTRDDAINAVFSSRTAAKFSLPPCGGSVRDAKNHIGRELDELAAIGLVKFDADKTVNDMFRIFVMGHFQIDNLDYEKFVLDLEERGFLVEQAAPGIEPGISTRAYKPK